MNACLVKLFKDGEITESVFKKLKEADNNILNDKTKLKTFVADEISKNETKRTKGRAHQRYTNAKTLELSERIKKSDMNPETELLDSVVKRKGMPAKGNNVETLIEEYRGRALTPLAPHLRTIMSKAGGLIQKKQLLSEISLKSFNPAAKVSSEASQITKAMDESIQIANESANAVGIATPINNLSQISTLSNRVVSVSEEQFIKQMRPLVTDSDEALKKIYSDARDGFESAQLSFVSADTEKKYRNIFGADAFTDLVNYLDRLSGETATAKVFGSNPTQTINNLAREFNIPKKEIDKVTDVLDFARGTNKGDRNPNVLAKTIAGARSIATASMLGSATLSALMDAGTMALTARVNGLPMMKMYSSLVKNLVSTNKRMELQQLGFQLDGVLNAINKTNRMESHSSPYENLNAVANGVLKVSGLMAWSDAAKVATKNTFLVTFRDLKGSTFDGLSKANPKFQRTLSRYDIGTKDWDVIRNSMNDEDLVLNPLNMDNTVGSKVFRLINEEGGYAVITPGARTQYATSFGGTTKGTILGESVRAVTQFKGSIVEQIFTHVMRAARIGTTKDKILYSAQLAFVTTVLGGMIYELKQLSAGKTPHDPTKETFKFVAESLKQGGAVPYLTDVLIPQELDPSYFDQNIIGATLTPAILGPLTKIFKDSKNSMGTGKRADKARADLARDITRLVPGQNLWYIKFFNEYLREMLARAIDEKSAKKRQRRINKEMKKQGQTTIFQP